MSVEYGIRNSEYWVSRAEEALAKAEEMQDLTAVATLREVARLYDLMARHAAAREARTSPRRMH
jgi:hypothetical protein